MDLFGRSQRRRSLKPSQPPWLGTLSFAFCPIMFGIYIFSLFFDFLLVSSALSDRLRMKSTLLPALGLPLATFLDLAHALAHGSHLDPVDQKVITSETTQTLQVDSPWAFIGCFLDDNDLPTLGDLKSPYTDDGHGTYGWSPPRCRDVCRSEGYWFAGLRRNRECWCGNFIGNDMSEDQADCSIPCNKSLNNACNAPDRISIYDIAMEHTGSVDGQRLGVWEHKNEDFVVD